MEYHKETERNAFGAPIWHIAETASTMDDAKEIASLGAEDGTVMYADYQSSGRGRVEGRVWESPAGESLLCTVILRRPAVPGFTLRVGLAVARTFDAFLPEGRKTAIKWPNDVLLEGKKLAGVLCEATGETLLVGTGLNLGQQSFSEALSSRATSLALALTGTGIPLPPRDAVLECYLENLRDSLAEKDWNAAVTARLWRKGELVSFLSGDPARNALCEGYVEGIGPSGELLFRPEAMRSGKASPTEPGPEGSIVRFFSGEIPY